MKPQRIELMVESVSRLVRRGATANMLKIFDKARPVEFATVLQNLPRPERRTAFSAVFEHNTSKTSETLAEMTPEVAVRLVEILETDDVARVLGEMSPDDAAEMLAEMDEERREEILARMHVETEGVEELLEFEEETAGRIMTPNVLALDEDMSIREAIAEMQKSDQAENSFYLYIIDDRNHLVGVSSLRALMMRYLRAADTKLRDIMQTDVISVRTDADQEEVARLVADYNLLAIPVVDDRNKLVGLVTVDDVVDVIRDEATEDILALAGVDADDRALGFAPQSFRRRIPWLLISLVTAMISVFVIAQFEDQLNQYTQLAFLLPLVAALGGHAATQTMTVIVRGVSTGEVNSETRRRAFFKEMVVGVLNGCLMSIVTGVAVGVFMGDTMTERLVLGVVMSISVFIIMIVASIIGAFFPILIKRLNKDPAVASSVFVITLTDVLGFLAYLGLAAAALTWFPDAFK